MRFLSINYAKRLAGLGLACAVAGSMAACEDPLAIEAPGALTSDELTGPGAVNSVINGIIGDFAEAYDDYVRYATLFTDEFILAGTFPTRLEVDDRRILAINGSLNAEVYEPLSTARFSADTGVVNFTAVLSDPDFAALTDELGEGIAYGRFFGGYSRLLLSELYCQSAIAGGPFLSSDDRMQDALDLLIQAEAAGNDAGLSELTNAAIVGQARANLWLGNDAAAATAARRVPTGFEFVLDYSENDPVQFNEVHSLTWGRGRQVIRWTVGDGTAAERNNERFPYFDEWVSLGLIDPNPPSSFSSFNSAISVQLQLLYDDGLAPILLASKAEADLIEAEVAVRAADFLTANTRVNNLRSTNWSLPAIDFAAMTTLAARLTQLAQERSRELWLTGQRQGTLRRLRANDGIDLYPAGSSASFDQTCFPVPQQEVDNNTNSVLFPNQ